MHIPIIGNRFSAKITMLCCLAVLSLAVVSCPVSVFAGTKLFVDSDDYKKDFRQGVIGDYSDLREGDGVEWVWIAPSIKLSKHFIEVGSFKNMSENSGRSVTDAVNSIFSRALYEVDPGGNPETLTTENAIYWTEAYSQGKRYIPFAGRYLAQSGIGVEMVFRDDRGKIVAKIRHGVRKGHDIKESAKVAADDILRFVLKN